MLKNFDIDRGLKVLEDGGTRRTFFEYAAPTDPTNDGDIWFDLKSGNVYIQDSGWVTSYGGFKTPSDIGVRLDDSGAVSLADYNSRTLTAARVESGVLTSTKSAADVLNAINTAIGTNGSAITRTIGGVQIAYATDSLFDIVDKIDDIIGPNYTSPTTFTANVSLSEAISALDAAISTLSSTTQWAEGVDHLVDFAADGSEISASLAILTSEWTWLDVETGIIHQGNGNVTPVTLFNASQTQDKRIAVRYDALDAASQSGIPAMATNHTHEIVWKGNGASTAQDTLNGTVNTGYMFRTASEEADGQPAIFANRPGNFQIVTVDTNGVGAAFLDGKYFKLLDLAALAQISVYFNVNDSNIADPSGLPNPILVDILSTDSAQNIATKIAAAIDAHTSFEASSNNTVVTITLSAYAALVPGVINHPFASIYDGTAPDDTTFAFAVDTYGNFHSNVKVGDFHWDVADGINLTSDYAATTDGTGKDISASDNVDQAIRHLDGRLDKLGTLLGGGIDLTAATPTYTPSSSINITSSTLDGAIGELDVVIGTLNAPDNYPTPSANIGSHLDNIDEAIGRIETAIGTGIDIQNNVLQLDVTGSQSRGSNNGLNAGSVRSVLFNLDAAIGADADFSATETAISASYTLSKNIKALDNKIDALGGAGLISGKTASTVVAAGGTYNADVKTSTNVMIAHYKIAARVVSGTAYKAWEVLVINDDDTPGFTIAPSINVGGTALDDVTLNVIKSGSDMILQVVNNSGSPITMKVTGMVEFTAEPV